MIKDSEVVSRSNKGEVKYSQVEKIKSANKCIGEIKNQIEKIANLLGLKYDNNGNLEASESLDYTNSQNFYLAMKILDSKIDYFMQHWSNYKQNDAIINYNFTNNLKTILKFNQRQLAKSGHENNKNSLNNSVHKFLLKYDSDYSMVEALNGFLVDAKKDFEFKVPVKRTDCFKFSRQIIEKLLKELVKSSNKKGLD